MLFEDLRGWMAGEDCVVVGCGPSAVWPGTTGTWEQWKESVKAGACAIRYREHWTIACNRSVSFASPDFAVCVEPARDRDAWDVVCASSPLVVFSHIDRPHPRSVLINSKDVISWFRKNGHPLRLGQSPFYAAAIATYLGFETVGMIGVDMTPDRYGDRDVEKANLAYGRLATFAESMGTRIIQLNHESAVKLPRGEWKDIRTK